MSSSWEQVLVIRVTRAFEIANCVHVLCPSPAVSRLVASLLTKHFERVTVVDWSMTADSTRTDAEREVFVGKYGDMCMLHLRVTLLAPHKAEFFSASVAVLVDYDRFSIGAVVCMLRSDDGDIVSQSDIQSFLGVYKYCVELRT